MNTWQTIFFIAWLAVAPVGVLAMVLMVRFGDVYDDDHEDRPL